MATLVAESLAALDHETDDREVPGDPSLDRVAAGFRAFMDALGLDRTDANLHGTEWRVARAFHHLFSGLQPGAEPVLRTFPNPEGYSEAVAVTDIPFHSICAHHFLPFFGTAHVAYVPRERLVGLSKLARVVDFYARRPQLQERMTEQVAELLQARLDPAGVLVVVQARHFCMEMRGVQKPGASTTTRAVRGTFVEERSRERLLSLHPSWPGLRPSPLPES